MTPYGPVLASPSALTFRTLGDSTKETVSQLNFPDKLTETDDCTGAATVVQLRNSGGQAAYQVTASNVGQCTITFKGGNGEKVKVPVDVAPYGNVKVTPGSLSFGGSSGPATVQVSQANFQGKFSDVNNCGTSVIQVGTPTYANGVASYVITPEGTASSGCTVTFKGGGGASGDLKVSLTPKATTVGPFSMEYSYAPDGKLEEQRFIMTTDPDVGTTKIAYALTPAGRPTQRSETVPGSPAMITTMGYDQYARLNSEVFPIPKHASYSNRITNMEYDPANELLGDNVNEVNTYPSITQGSTPQTYAYSSRGELIQVTGGDSTTNDGATMYEANGVQVYTQQKNPSAKGETIGATWDARMGAVIHSEDKYETRSGGCWTATTVDTDVTYDAWGRSASSGTSSLSDAAVDRKQNPDCPLPTGAVGPSTGVTRTYDVENHLRTADGLSTNYT